MIGVFPGLDGPIVIAHYSTNASQLANVHSHSLAGITSAHFCAVSAGNAISISSAFWKQLQWELIPMKTIAGLNLRHQLNALDGEKPELNKGNNQQGEITTQLCTINWQSDLCNSVSAECSGQSTDTNCSQKIGQPNMLHAQ